MISFDKWFTRIARWFSYVSVAAILFMAFFATADILSSKFIGRTFNNVSNLIEYMLILVVYCAVASAVLDTGMMQVDLLLDKFPKKLQRVIEFAGCVGGFFVYGLAAYTGFQLFKGNYASHQMASPSSSSFQIWPFTLIYVVGTCFLVIALLWRTVRLFKYGGKPADGGPLAEEVGQLSEEG